MSEETMRIVVEQIDYGNNNSLGADTVGNKADQEPTAANAAMDIGTNLLLSVVNPVLGALATGVEIAVEAFEKFKTQALDFAEKISQNAPNVQAAFAQREQRMVGAQMEADQIAGPELRRLIDAQARSDAALLKIEAQFTKLTTSITAPIEEIRASILEGVNEAVLNLTQAQANQNRQAALENAERAFKEDSVRTMLGMSALAERHPAEEMPLPARQGFPTNPMGL